MSNNTTSDITIEAATQSPIVEHFGIHGLFGYRSVCLDSNSAATILIAQNGAGKTTLLGALDAFLNCQFGRLKELQFSKIECRLRGIKNLLILHKEDLDKIQKFAENSAVAKIAKNNELDVSSVINFVAWEYSDLKKEPRKLLEHPIFRKIYSRPQHTLQSAKNFFDEIAELARLEGSAILEIKKSIKSVLSEYEIVYLPTYRRIEISLPKPDETPMGRRQSSIQSRLGMDSNSLHSGNIQFGISDISERLNILNTDILADSNQSYREVSANIISDLITGDFERDIPSLEERPTKEALTLFFTRLNDSRMKIPTYGPLEPIIRTPNLDKIYDDTDIPEKSKKFLNYFLGKLNTVLQKTRDVESVVQEFVNNCNTYLSKQDISTTPPNKNSIQNTNDDSKILTLDRKNLGVTVISQITKRKISLDALSSGEKQMISLFARLFLYPNKKIILIDEPELSLSIDWQRKILVDIMNAPLCSQLIAITHSPFIFDNDLEPFATALRSRIDPFLSNKNLSPDEEAEDEHE